MALIFLGVLIVFTIASFAFQQVRLHCLDFIANDGWPQFTQHQSTGVSGSSPIWPIMCLVGR